MLKFTALAPTKRECILVLILLGCLWLSGAGHGVRQSYFGLRKKKTPSPDSDHWRTHLTWSSDQVLPSTNMVAHAAGCTVFDNLFLLNGSFIVVTDDPASIPAPELITSKGLQLANGREAFEARRPTEREFRVITTPEAKRLFEAGVDVIDGTTWILTDPPQFTQHYFHWVAEVFYAFWRTYASLDPSISLEGRSRLPALRRVWLPYADAYHWRDYASMNQLVLRGSFPSATAEYAPDWLDRAATGRPMLLDRVIVTDRAAMHNGENNRRIHRATSEPLSIPASENWWSVIQGSITTLSGFDPQVDQGARPVISYISRQGWGGRKLISEHHEKLVEALYRLRDEHDIEVNVVNMHELTQAEQIKLAARTTIMMGVHGNGLTSLLWMKRNPQSTVMEFFIPGGFTRDYQYTAYGVGLVYYAVWDDQAFTDPNLPKVNFPEGFHGNGIPVNGEAIAKLCLERLGINKK